jgi:hypothetical protein
MKKKEGGEPQHMGAKSSANRIPGLGSPESVLKVLSEVHAFGSSVARRASSLYI